ncbi:MAG: Na/Pi symporter [Akkermansiaceae bacterium]
MYELLAKFLVGITLFLHGVAGVRIQLQGLTSRRLSRQLVHLSSRRLIAATGGFLFGAITQSSTAVAFILNSLISSGLLPLSKALPVVAWANVGTVLLVFFASLNIHLVFLYVLGMAGLAIAFEVGTTRYRSLIQSLFSVGLLFLGLKLMKEAFAPLPEFPFFQQFATLLHGSLLLTFATGILLRVVIQSSSAIAVVIIALHDGNLLNQPESAMMMYGSGLGVALTILLLSSNVRGVARQLTLFQALINSGAGCILGVVAYLESLHLFPPILGSIMQFSTTHAPGMELAIAFLLLQSTTLTLALLLRRWMPSWLQRLSPPTHEQDLSRPLFLCETALADPESALDLAEAEQKHLLTHLPALLDTLRPRLESTPLAIPTSVRHRAIIAVSGELQAYLRELVEKQIDPATSARLLSVEQRQAILSPLCLSVYEFVETISRQEMPATSPRFTQLIESLDTLILTLLDALDSRDASDLTMLTHMTADRGGLMERQRRNLIESTPDLEHSTKSDFFYLTALYERSIWLMRQFVQLHLTLATPPPQA